jgi:glutathione S-transferase
MKAALGLGLAGGDWLLPQGFTGADLLIGGNLAWFVTWAPQAFADLPGIDAYVARIRARPAHVRAWEREAEIAQSLAARTGG